LKFLLDACDAEECLKFMMTEDEQKCTPLHLACKNGSQECIELMLEREADLMTQLRQKGTDIVG